LQDDVLKIMSVKVSGPAIRKFLHSKGYRWLPRSQKRIYNAEDRRLRLAFAKRILRVPVAELDKHVACATDGVVLTKRPVDPTEALNYCLHGETDMYRKRSEACKPELSGDDPYADQIPLSRAIPLWGAISSAGYRDIFYHKTKKVNTEEWLKALNKGKLLKAVRELQPWRPAGPRRILCDNESFIKSKGSKKYYKKNNIELLCIPPRSPDLNPIEMYWAWLRKALRRQELSDLRAKKPALGKTAYRARIKAFLKTKKAQTVAKAIFGSLRGKCKEVIRKKGAAIRS